MSAERYYINSDLKVDDLIPIEDQEFHHLIHVIRTKQGEMIEIINGQGILAAAALLQIGKKQAIIQVQSILKHSQRESKIILAQAIPRINRLDFILEKGTELGMTDLWLFPGRFSERKSLTDHQLDRLRGLSIAAIKQCDRLWLPTITVLPSIHDWKSFEYHAYFGDLSDAAPLFSHTLNLQTIKQGIIFVIGPESGFEKSEEDVLKSLGAQGVKLHQNVLRTDTASIVALSLITCQ